MSVACESDHACNVSSLTAQHVGADVGGTASLVLQQIVLAHQVLSQAEVGDGDPMSPKHTTKQTG